MQTVYPPSGAYSLPHTGACDSMVGFQRVLRIDTSTRRWLDACLQSTTMISPLFSVRRTPFVSHMCLHRELFFLFICGSSSVHSKAWEEKHIKVSELRGFFLEDRRTNSSSLGPYLNAPMAERTHHVSKKLNHLSKFLIANRPIIFPL